MSKWNIQTKQLNKTVKKGLTTLLLWIKAVNSAKAKGYTEEEIADFAIYAARRNGKPTSLKRMAKMLLKSPIKEVSKC